ncbi:MAG TPA: hypothetical protein VFN39_09600 [Gemmatimonadaceae bacterium]|nr:hypothetical protein [Gemmatimonadaceae bacterium]
MKNAFVVAAAITSISIVACTDSNAPDTRSCVRGTLAQGASVRGTLDSRSCTTRGDLTVSYVDYRVALVAGQRYLFTLRGENRWHPTLELISDADPAAPPVTGWFTDGDASGAGATSEILIVPALSGNATLRIRDVSTGGAYALRSGVCGGSSQEIFTSGSISAQGSIDAGDCVIHDRWLQSDSAFAETFVLYLGREELKTVSVKARGASIGAFNPSVVVIGPFVAGMGGASTRQVTYSSSDSLSMQVQGASQAGDYIVAVAGRTPTMMGDYTLTVGPPAP